MNFQTKKARELRQLQTKAESKLWQILRNRNFLDLKFRRQFPIKNFIVDFCCFNKQLIIELGDVHNNAFQQDNDAKRTFVLEKLGYTILRFENKIVFDQPELILQEIRSQLENPLTPALSPGRGSVSVLSTKKLTPSQREILRNTNIDLVEYNAISIEDLPFEIKGKVENAIITSQNSARILITSKIQINKVFCVGDKTASLLLEKDYSVLKTAKNASKLADFIVKECKRDDFVFFCGNKRRSELPEILQENKVNFTEEIVYNTVLNPKVFKKDFDAVLFYSPSGVQSYVQENALENSIAFCIGNTTANEARKHTSKIVIANKTTIESGIVQLAKHFKA